MARSPASSCVARTPFAVLLKIDRAAVAKGACVKLAADNGGATIQSCGVLSAGAAMDASGSPPAKTRAHRPLARRLRRDGRLRRTRLACFAPVAVIAAAIFAYAGQLEPIGLVEPVRVPLQRAVVAAAHR